MFTLNDWTTTVEFGRYKGVEIQARIESNWSFNHGIVLGVYNHWAIQSHLTSRGISYPKLFVAFATPGFIHIVTTPPTITVHNMDTLRTVTRIFEVFGKNLIFNSIPKIATYQDGVGFDLNCRLLVKDGCEESDAHVCTRFTKGSSLDPDYSRRVVNFYLYLINAHKETPGVFDDVVKALILTPDFLLGTQNTYFSIVNIIQSGLQKGHLTTDWKTIVSTIAE